MTNSVYWEGGKKSEAIMGHRVDRIFIYLILVAFGAFFISSTWPTNKIFGIPKDYLVGGAVFILIMVIMGWAAVVMYQRRY